MNTSSDYPFFLNSSLELEADKTPSMYGRYAVVMFIIGILIMLLNIIGIKLVNNSKTIVKNLQVYISSLMACDFFIGFNISLSPLTFWFFRSRFVVDLFSSIVRSFVISSLLHTAVLSMDRLLSIKQPNFYTLRITPKICVGLCACIWFVAALYSIMAHALVPFYPMNGQFDVGVYSSFMVIYFSCLFVYVGCSRSIIVCAKEHIRRNNIAPWLVVPTREQQNLDNLRLSIIVTTASGFLFILYLPAQIFAFLTFIDSDRKFKVTVLFQDLAFPFFVMESLLGPLLYLLRFRETRQMIKRLCCSVTREVTVSTNT